MTGWFMILKRRNISIVLTLAYGFALEDASTGAIWITLVYILHGF